MERVWLSVLALFVATASRLVFWRGGLNYAEHLILTTYLYAQAVLLLAVGMLVVWTLPREAQTVASIVLLGAAAGIRVWLETGLALARLRWHE